MALARCSTVALAGLFIFGCSAGPGTDPPPPPAKTVFDPLTQDLKKAQALQQAVDQNTGATRDAIEREERGDAKP